MSCTSSRAISRRFENFLDYSYVRTDLGTNRPAILNRANDQAPSASKRVMAASGSICRARFPPSLNTSLGLLAQTGWTLDAVSTGASTRDLPQGPTRVQEKTRIHWGSLIGEELLYISAKNAFRLDQNKTRSDLGNLSSTIGDTFSNTLTSTNGATEENGSQTMSATHWMAQLPHSFIAAMTTMPGT
jgi:hypothetical protein